MLLFMKYKMNMFELDGYYFIKIVICMLEECM